MHLPCAEGSFSQPLAPAHRPGGIDRAWFPNKKPPGSWAVGGGRRFTRQPARPQYPLKSRKRPKIDDPTEAVGYIIVQNRDFGSDIFMISPRAVVSLRAASRDSGRRWSLCYWAPKKSDLKRVGGKS